MLKKSYTGTWHDYEHSYQAKLGNYGKCDVYRLSRAEDYGGSVGTVQNWFIVGEKAIVSFGDIPKTLKQEHDVILHIFGCIKHGDIYDADILDDFEGEDRDLVKEKLATLIEEGSLERREDLSYRIPT